MNLDSPRWGWIAALAMAGIGVAWAEHGKIEALEKDSGMHAADAADLRAWRLSVESALRNCKPTRPEHE